MKTTPWKYTAEIMSSLLYAVSPEHFEIIRKSGCADRVIRDFILSGEQLNYQDLIDEGIIPNEVSIKDICCPDYRIPQKSIRELGSFPPYRTDVYFVGVPFSGKTSILAGIMYRLFQKGLAAYEPHFVNGIDPCASYYRGLIKAMASKKPPVGTPTDSISFTKLNIRNGVHRNEMTIVEISGEVFKGIAGGQESIKDRWECLGATQCLKVTNRKCLFFVIDYSVVRGLDGVYCNNIDQAMMLNDALRVFLNDGPDFRKPSNGCTMSKVDIVAIIMTKCDLMWGANNRNERLDIAKSYIEDHFSNFTNDLHAACRRFGINCANHCQPYIITFSLGKFYVGNTVVFDGSDSDKIIKFISSVTKSEKGESSPFFRASIDSLSFSFSSVIKTLKERSKRSKRYCITFLPTGNTQDNTNVYSSIFAPAEIKHKSHMLVQVYLHLFEETEKVKALALESNNDAERRDYIPLQCKLKKGDKVNIQLNIYGETLLMSDKKSVVWQGSFTKCCFDFFVPKELEIDELSCVALLTVNDIPVGEMRFITKIVESPRQLNPEIIAHKYNKVFISYAHKDEAKVKSFHEGLKLAGIEHFFDRAYLKAGDIFPQVIQDYINSADLFVLFWSENALKSDYVDKERKQALGRAFPQVKPQQAAKLSIYPMSIEPRAELPSDMKDNYHFGEI